MNRTKSFFIPLIATAVCIAIAYLAPLYYRSDLYTGVRTVTNPDNDVNILAVAFILGICVFLKYLLYDWLGRKLLKRSPSIYLKAKAMFWSVYSLALAIDILAIFSSSKPAVDSGFAIFGLILYSPPLLLVGLLFMCVAAFFSRKRA
jgi:hypothetical protein